MKKYTYILAFLTALVLALPAIAQVTPAIAPDTITNSGTMKGTRIIGQVSFEGADGAELIVGASDTINARVRLGAYAMAKGVRYEITGDTINLGYITSLVAKQWRFPLDTLLRGVRKNQVGATPPTAWQCMPWQWYVEIIPDDAGNCVLGGTSTPKWVWADIRKLPNRGSILTVVLDTAQNSGTLKLDKTTGVTKRIAGSFSFEAYDSVQFIGASSDSITGYWRLVGVNVRRGIGTVLPADTVFLISQVATKASAVRMNYTQIKAAIGSAWLAWPRLAYIEFVPDTSGNAELPVGSTPTAGIQPEWITGLLRVFPHRP